MKKIIYDSKGWELGGIERFIVSVAPLLDSSQYRFDVFSVHDRDSSFDSKIEAWGHRYTVFSGEKPSLAVRYTEGPAAFRRLIEKNNYDIAHLNIMNGAGLKYAQIARSTGIPLVIAHSHNTTFGAGGRSVKSAIHKISLSRYGDAPNMRLACSREAGAYLFGNKDFEVIHNPVDLGKFSFDEASRRETRQRLGVGDETILFGSVGRLVPEKNPLFQLEILHVLRDKGIDAKLLLVGAGPQAEELTVRASELGVGEHLLLPSATAEVVPYYCALDVFSMPSAFEGLGTTKIEAIACGLPCVTSDNVPSADFSENIWVVRQLNPSVWGKAIVDAAKAVSGTTARRMGEAIIRAYHYDSRSVAETLSEKYSAGME